MGKGYVKKGYKRKLTDEQVYDIKSAPKNVSRAILAKRHSIAKSTVSDIQMGKTHKNLYPELTRGKHEHEPPKHYGVNLDDIPTIICPYCGNETSKTRYRCTICRRTLDILRRKYK